VIVFVSLFLFFIPTHSRASFFATAISGGIRATASSPLFRHLVSLEFRNKNSRPQGQCTGVVVSNWHILTARHCLQHSGQLVVSFFPPLGQAQEINAKSFQVMRNSKSSSGHCDNSTDNKKWCLQSDIGVVELSEMIPSGMQALPVILNPIEFVEKTESLNPPLITGFGLASSASIQERKFGTLRSTSLRYSRIEREMMVFWDLKNTKAAGQPGDSGAPVLLSSGQNYFIIGIIVGGETRLKNNENGKPFFFEVTSAVQLGDRPVRNFLKRHSDLRFIQ
jgi:hypothetical protein